MGYYMDIFLIDGFIIRYNKEYSAMPTPPLDLEVYGDWPPILNVYADIQGCA
jgi:hypothetical protein